MKQKLDFVFLSCPTFEEWDWTNPMSVGIGGSETSHVEVSARLSRRGHQVYSYAPTPYEEVRRDPAGVTWERCDKGDFSRPGVWVIYRDPEMIDGVKPGNPCWLICQDVDYPTMTEARGRRVDRIVALCDDHAEHLRSKWPFAADKVCVSSNGIRSAVIEEVDNLQCIGGLPPRNPRRLMYASSPDRGLWNLLHIFERVRELVSDVELHVYYGFNNIEKIIDRMPYAAALRSSLLERLQGPGITWHGRIGQAEMYREWFQAGLWCHPSEFTETSCITCMDAQACGAIPVTSPIWAVGQNVQHGVMIDGLPERDPITRARYVLEVLKLIQDPERQELIRWPMMKWARETFDWERFVDQWESWASEDLARYGRSFGVVEEAVA